MAGGTVREPDKWLAIKLQAASLVVLLLVGTVVLLASGYFLARLKMMRDTRIEQHQEINRRLDLLEKRAPCDGCFDSLKWRVDELRALHGVGAREMTEGAHEREAGEATGEVDQER